MIHLAFTAQRKVVRFEIEDSNVRYFDDNWKHGLIIYPYPKANVKQMLASRSERMQAMGLLIHDANSGENIEEYNACKSDGDIAEMIRKDCRKKGLVEVK